MFNQNATYNPSPNHNHTEFNSDLNIHVTGGDRVERELLVDAVSSALKKRGLEGVKAIGPHGWATGHENVQPKTILDHVEKLRPDLMNKNIAVTSQQDKFAMHAGLSPMPVKFSASNADGKSISSSSGTAKQFLAEASEMGVSEKITVSGTYQDSLIRAAQEILHAQPATEVTLKMELQPWQVRQNNDAYYAPPFEPGKVVSTLDPAGIPLPASQPF